MENDKVGKIMFFVDVFKYCIKYILDNIFEF